MSLKDRLRRPEKVVTVPRQGPLWGGPSGTCSNSGVTQGLICRWLNCRERCRIKTMEGLRPVETFNYRLEFGNLWHTCEEALAGGKGKSAALSWLNPLQEAARDLGRRYPMQQQEVERCYEACKIQFPLYVDFWAKHPDVTGRTPLLQEAVFDIPYRLPSGRIVRLRGKWDSVDLIGEGKNAGIFLCENKTKSDIDEGKIKRQLTGDLQSMLYLTALMEELTNIGHVRSAMFGSGPGKAKIAGVRYNVVRRLFSGGKGNVVQGKGTLGTKCSKCKGTGSISKEIGVHDPCPKCHGAGRIGGKPPETKEAYYERAAQYVRDEPEVYFMRWSVGIQSGDVARFRRETLDPILENMLDDHEWWAFCFMQNDLAESCTSVDPSVIKTTPYDYEIRAKWYPKHRLRHFRHPFGVWNSLDENGSSDLDEYLSSGSLVGLERTDVLFPELVE